MSPKNIAWAWSLNVPGITGSSVAAEFQARLSYDAAFVSLAAPERVTAYAWRKGDGRHFCTRPPSP